VTIFLNGGGYGSVYGKFIGASDIAVNASEVYISEYDNQRVQVFSKDGQFQRSWNTSYRLKHVAVDASSVFLSDNTGGRTPGENIYVYSTYGAIYYGYGFGDNNVSAIAVHSPFAYAIHKDGKVSVYRRYFRTLGSSDNTSIPQAGVVATQQRESTSLLDIDYCVKDWDNTTSKVYAAAFAIGSGETPSLRKMIPMLTFAEGTDGNIGKGVSVDDIHRVTWDMAADGVDEQLAGYGDLNLSFMANDGRPPLDLHFITIPAVNGNPSFEINRSPLYDTDFIQLWFWYLAAGDGALNLTTGCVYGVGGSYDGQLLAYDTTTTDVGRDFLFNRMNLRVATSNELLIAREASTPGTVTEWVPRRTPPSSSYRVNEFNFVTNPDDGWRGVKKTP